MATQVSQLTDNEREWFDYFMASYSKDQIVVMYIYKIREIVKLEGEYNGVLYD